jgi:hypothetical protein
MLMCIRRDLKLILPVLDCFKVAFEIQNCCCCTANAALAVESRETATVYLHQLLH